MTSRTGPPIRTSASGKMRRSSKLALNNKGASSTPNFATRGKAWSRDEIEILRNNRDKTAKSLLSLLPERTLYSIIHKRNKAGFDRINPTLWSRDEDRLLRRLADTTTASELTGLFHNRSYESIRVRAKYLGLSLKSNIETPRRTGNDLIDAVRARSIEDGISLTALDRELGIRNYFASNCIRGYKTNLKNIAKAVAFFGGELKGTTIDWKDE